MHMVQDPTNLPQNMMLLVSSPEYMSVVTVILQFIFSSYCLIPIALLITKDDLIQLIGLKTCVKWSELALYLGIEKHIRDEVSLNCHRVAKDCFIEMVGRWLSHEDGTGDSPRTWETMFGALCDMGQSYLVEEVKAELFKTTPTEGKVRF